MENKRFLTGLALLGFTALITPTALAQTPVPEEKVLSYVKEMPAFEGGITEQLNFISSNLQYPQDALATGTAGIVVTSFIVETNRSLSNFEIVKGLSATLDAEATRVAKLMEGKWSVGKHDGKPVRVKVLLPVRFSLDQAGNLVASHKMPQFRGGQEVMAQTIYKHLKTPAAAQKENLDARVEVNFTVESDGKVSNISVADTKLRKMVSADAELYYMDAATFKLSNRAVLAQLQEAAAGAVRATSGMWEPGIKNGKPAAADLRLPVLVSGSGSANVAQQLESTMVTYQTDAYDRKASYTASEVDVYPSLKEEPLEKFLAQHLRYPNPSFEGLVKVAFFITQNGTIIGPMTNVSQEQPAIAEEIKRVFKLTEHKWVPARKNTQPVTALQEIQIAFVSGTGKEAIPARVVVRKK
ncbi:MAG: energy transducer TonB [Hymenobacteraceae bacterium]|nr:energy transducer TonB [Hymenobacteraceae bacterium]